MTKTRKIPRNYSIELVALAVIVRKDYTFDVMPLNIRSNWYSLVGLNPTDGRMRTKNKKLYRFLKANQTQKQREETMRRVHVLFD